MTPDLQQFGNKMIIAGKKQVETGTKLKSYSDKTKHVGETLLRDRTIDQSIDSVETGTRSVRAIIYPIANVLHNISDMFNAVTVPTIDFTRKTIEIPILGSQKFITGITLGSTKPFRSIATALENAADDLDKIRAALLTIADAMNMFQAQLPAISNNIITSAQDMKQAGSDMTDSGNAMIESGKLLGGN